MRTITFYSYKGGVGRSLALANIAKRLAEFNKKVCIIDFDLEAPGIPAKFSSELKSTAIKKGLVDYIYQYHHEGSLPKTISDFSVEFSLSNTKVPISLIAAGDTESGDYWKKLSSINWYELLYEDNNSLSFFLNLKEKIKKEINPDFLLIDSRTGISEMSGISISLLADEVVIIAANNKENLDGAKKIIKSLSKTEILLLDAPPKTTLVLSRIPFTNSPKDRAKEQVFISRIKREFEELYNDDIIIIHSDRELEEKESLKLETDKEDSVRSIANDYLKLFERLTEKLLKPDELKRFDEIKQANRIYNSALEEESPLKRIELINGAIELNSENLEYYIFRGAEYSKLKDYDNAIKDYNHVLSVEANNIKSIHSLAFIYYVLKEYSKSNEYSDFLIKINPNSSSGYFQKALNYEGLKDELKVIEHYKKSIELEPQSVAAYNNLSNHYKHSDNLEEAKQLIYKALELNPQFGVAYATLAEINAHLGNIQEFYLNFELALMYTGKDIEEAFLKEKIYEQFLKDERFKNLLQKYDISIPDTLTEKIEATT